MWIWSISSRSNDRLRFKRRNRQSNSFFVVVCYRLLICARTDQCWFISTMMIGFKSVYCMNVVYCWMRYEIWLLSNEWSIYRVCESHDSLILFGQVIYQPSWWGWENLLVRQISYQFDSMTNYQHLRNCCNQIEFISIRMSSKNVLRNEHYSKRFELCICRLDSATKVYH
jgi:hypothetical protein